MGHAPRFHIRPGIAAPLAVAAALAASAALSLPALAQVVINEIYPNPPGSAEGGLERVEIYNAGSTPVDMTGWAIDDAATIDQAAVRARIPEDLDPACSTNPVIGPGQFRSVMMMGSQAVLNNGGDDVYLVSNRLLAATVVHAVTYPSASAQEGNVWSALPNGSANFDWRSQTLCASNGATGDVVAPGSVSNLTAIAGSFPGEIRLTWTAPGDDGASGTASAYLFKVSHAPITGANFDAAADLDRWRLEPLPAAGGTPETLYVFGLDPDSTWYFALEAQDEVPNTSAVSNSPGSAPAAGTLLDPDLGYSAFFGNLHSHTGYSDGVQTPADAYAFARLAAPTPLDFLAVTEHNHAGAGMSLPNYALARSEAAAANDDGDFVAICGQEWGVIATGGHVNLFEAPVLFGWEPGNYDVYVAEGDYTGLYTAFLAHPPVGYPAVASLCHPAAGDFNDLALTNDSKAVVHGMALVSGPAFSTSTTESDVGNTGYDDEFMNALRKGHRVSPVGDQDNHYATWGAAVETRTAVLAAGKTKSEILGALAVGRNYATQDHNTVVQFSADGHAMGSAWTSADGIRIAARVTDPDPGDAVAEIDLLRGITGVSNATVVGSSVGSATFQWRETQTFAAGTEAHYYLRIRMADNANIWTGPVYVTYDPNATTAVGDWSAPGILALAANPNPAVGRITASFALARAEGHASLVVYDAAGRRVRTLLDGPLEAGTHQVTWNGQDDAGRATRAGIFFLRLEAGAQAASRKVLFLR